MTSAPNNLEDMRAKWARSRLATGEPGENSPVAMWIGHLEKEGDSAAIADWVAFQVLQGDDSNWQSALRAANREVLDAQWQEISTFAGEFLELSASEKQQRFALLDTYLQGNLLALRQLERYRPFLDLDADGTQGESPDVAELIRAMILQAISGPLERRRLVADLLGRTEKGPIRWRAAATELQRHSRWSQVAPILLDHIARIDRQQDSPRQIANRNSFKWRYGSSIRRHKLRNLTARLRPGVPLVFLVIVLYVVWTANWNKNPTDFTAPRTQNLPRNFAPATIDPESLNETLLDSERSKVLAELLGAQAGFAYIENLKAQWAKTARTGGSEGLAEIEAKLNLATKQTDKVELATAAARMLSLFRAWRLKEGDAIAKTTDEAGTADDRPQAEAKSVPSHSETESEPSIR